MSFRNVVNDGSQNPPRLRTQLSLWVLTGIPRGGPEWSIVEKFDRVAAAGYTGFELGANSVDEAREFGKMLKDRGLGVGFKAYPRDPDDLLPFIERAHAARADYINAQVVGSLRATPEIADALKEMYELANDSGLPFFVETHRGRVTQDLRRTLKVLKRLPKMRFTGDFSHYVAAGEIVGTWPQEIWDAFTTIAEKCSNFHGRISNGEQIQIDIGDGSNDLAQQFKKLWTIGIKKWLSKSRPGDVLPFMPEPGPPGYSVVDLEGREISDRWEQALVIRRLGEEAWADAQTNATR